MSNENSSARDTNVDPSTASARSSIAAAPVEPPFQREATRESRELFSIEDELGRDISEWTDEEIWTEADAYLSLWDDSPDLDSPDSQPVIQPLPIVPLPGPDLTVTDTSSRLGALLAPRQVHFVRGGQVVRIEADEDGAPIVQPVEPIQLVSDFEKVATLAKVRRTLGGPITQQTTCPEASARAILASQDFLAELPRLRLFSRCPVVVESGGELKVVVGYDELSGVLARGTKPIDMPLANAVELLSDLLTEFNFATPSDRSRALAALITPALTHGGLLKGRAALDLGEADDSQSGKGYRHKLTAAIYGQTIATVVQQKAGVGSMEEAFDRALIAGRTFISLDNVRGRIDSPKIESFLTEDSYNARCAHSRNMAIDPRRTSVMFTSNKADLTQDLANRCSSVRILKQPADYEYRQFPEGDLLARVCAQQPQYLGAVFAVVKAWYAAGKPQSAENRHDFRAWAQTLDWIVQNLLQAATLLDGHRETQERMTNPALNWLREVTIALNRQQRSGEWLSANAILDCIEENGNIVTPGVRDDADLEDADVRRRALSQLGKLFKRCFSDESIVELDGLAMERRQYKDEQYRDRWEYVVYRLGDPLPYVPF